MAITSYSQSRIGNITTVTVVSGLGGTIYYHWYKDGAYVGMTTVPRRDFVLRDGEEAVIVCQDTNSSSYDGYANAPAGYPAQREIEWCRSVDSDVDHYRIAQSKGGAVPPTVIGKIRQGETWLHRFRTGRLDDLSNYAFQIYPVDSAGNEGTQISGAAKGLTERIVRTPDAPDFSLSYDGVTEKVTISAA